MIRLNTETKLKEKRSRNNSARQNFEHMRRNFDTHSAFEITENASSEN